MLSPGQVINGRYRLATRIGEGAMAAVWRAEDQTLRREVAIKFLFVRGGPDPKAHVEQFLREARMAASVQHRNVIHTVDFGTLEDHQPYIVMELLSGENLAERLAREPKLAPAQFIQLIGVTLRGLQAVHDAGIVHRDLKPENIFLQREADTVFPKILDFGISRSLEGGANGRASAIATTEGLIVGTPEYMSPEQARGESNIDKRSDIYSIGVILYEGLAGRPPFQADTVGDLIVQIMTQPAPDLMPLCPGLPPALGDVIAQAMTKDREQRFADARALRTALLTAAKPLLPESSTTSAVMPAVVGPRLVAPPAIGMPPPAAGRAPLPAIPVAAVAAAPAVPSAPAPAAAPPGIASPPAEQTAPAALELQDKAPAASAGGWGDFEGIARAPAPPRENAANPPPAQPAARRPSVQFAAAPAPTAPARRELVDLDLDDGGAPAVLARSPKQASPASESPSVAGRAAPPTADRASASPRNSRSQAALPAQDRANGAEPKPGAAARGSKSSVEFAAVGAPGAAPARKKAGPAAPHSGLEIDALDPLYAGADQAAPDIDYARVNSEVKKSPAQGQPAAQPTKARPSKQKARNVERSRARSKAISRSWLLPVIALLLLGYAFFESLFGGFGWGRGAAVDESGARRPDAALDIDPELRKTRLHTKARRANPGKAMPHMRDVEF